MLRFCLVFLIFWILKLVYSSFVIVLCLHAAPPCLSIFVYLRCFPSLQGHVDFSYEVSRSISACQGVLLIVDANQVQNQISQWVIADVFAACDAVVNVLLSCEGGSSANGGQLLLGFWGSAGNHPCHQQGKLETYLFSGLSHIIFLLDCWSACLSDLIFLP